VCYILQGNCVAARTASALTCTLLSGVTLNKHPARVFNAERILT
jgi:hypothetical protein